MNKIKLLLLATAIHATAIGQTQYVQNGSFEAGHCSGGTFPAYLGTGSPATSWTGVNMGSNPSIPVTTGRLFDNGVGCFASRFYTGYGPRGGYRAISIEMLRDQANYITDEHAIGTTTFPAFSLPNQWYQLCISTCGIPVLGGFSVNSELEVILRSSTNPNFFQKIANIPVPNTNAWQDHSIGFYYNGGADRIELRMNRNVLSAAQVEVSRALIDNVSIFKPATPGSIVSCVPAARLAGNTVAEAAAVDVKCTPNPVYGLLQVTLPANVDPAHTKIAITDIQGRIAITQETDQHVTSVDMSALPAGVYFVKVQSANISATQKIVKE